MKTLQAATALRIPDVLDPAEEKRLIASAVGRLRLHHRLILSLMLDCGLRSCEVLSLRAGDINYASGALHTYSGKYRKDRILWIPERTLALLCKYRRKLERVRGTAATGRDQLLFTTASGKPID